MRIKMENQVLTGGASDPILTFFISTVTIDYVALSHRG